MPQQQELGSYGQFCPVAMAAEVVCSRWTALIVREMLCGSTRFNDLRRGVPLMSPTLLSKRLKELEHAGVIMAVPTGQAGVFDYKLTEAGEDLRPVVMALGIWGQRWVDFNLTLQESRSVAADVGHAAQPRSDAAAAEALHHQLHLSRRSRPGSAHGGSSSTTARSICARPIRASRSISMCAVAAQHDVHLDGALDRAERDRRGPDRADRRQERRPVDAAMARAEPVRQREEAGVA